MAGGGHAQHRYDLDNGHLSVEFTITSGGSGTGYTIFVVRDDSSTADILYQVATTTYQAYNNWGGRSLYTFNSDGGVRAYKVSYNRPYTYDQGNGYLYAGDYDMVRFLEREGYNVAYATSEDTHANPNLMDNHRVFLSNYHDEYWSWQMRQHLTNWRDQGKNIAIFSSNNIYWQIRYEDGLGAVPQRTVTCYKSAALDPMAQTGTPWLTTTLFRDPPVNMPENELLGVMYHDNFGDAISFDYVVVNAWHFIYENTGLVEGSAIPLVVGDEYDNVWDNGLTPTNLILLSASPIPVTNSVSNASIYTAPSGAMVFDASTNRWARFLDTNTEDSIDLNPTMVQMTKNLLNTMIVDLPPVVVSTAPTDDALGVDSAAPIQVTYQEPTTAASGAYDISCTVGGTLSYTLSGSGTNTHTLTHAPFAEGAVCTVTVDASKISDVDGNDPPDVMAANYSFSFNVAAPLVCGALADSIPAIQGSGISAAQSGQRIVEGIVTGDFQASDQLGGFFMQAVTGDGDPATSDGIFVVADTSLLNVSVGQRVRVVGEVREQDSETQIVASGAVVCGTGSIAPTAVTLPYTTITYAERYEGMLVSFGQTLAVTNVADLWQFGQFSVSSGGRLYEPTQTLAPGTAAVTQLTANALNQLVVDDGSNTAYREPIPYPSGGLTASNTLRTGTTVSGLQGIFGARGTGYRLHLTTAFTQNVTNPRTAAPAGVGGTLRAAAFDLNNYFNGESGVFSSPLGASNAAEFTRQRNKIIAAIAALDADVLVVTGIENDGSGAQSAMQDLLNGINAATAPNTYAFIADPATGVSILPTKSAIFYKPSKLTPTGAAVSDTDAVWDRYPIAQAFTASNGGKFTVIAVHLTDRDCYEAQTGGQNCFDAERTAQATRLLTFAADMQTASSDPDILLLGRLNTYAQEAPLVTLKNGGFVDRQQGLSTPYTHVFNGNFGYLMYAMPSSTLNGQLGNLTIWHINADEPPALDYNTENKSPAQQTSLYAADAYRSAVQDPVLAGLSLTPSAITPAVAATSPTNNALNVNPTSNITVTFNQAVNAGSGAFSLTCTPGGTQNITPSSSPSTQFALNPMATLPRPATCTVTITAAQISAADNGLNLMAADYVFSFSTKADPIDTIGVFRPSNANFYLKKSNSDGPADIFVWFGESTDLPLVGDWNSDGIDTVGIFRNGTFYLKDENAYLAPIVHTLLFGVSGDLPVAGDWNGDGVSGIGVFRNGVFYLKDSLTSGFPNYYIAFGAAGDLPLAGDWNGDGVDSPGLYRPSAALFFASDVMCASCSATLDYIVSLGMTGDVGFAGDWDGNGKDGLGVFRPSNGITYMRNTLTDGFADIAFVYGIAGDKPFAGVWEIPAGDGDTAPVFVPRR